ncbi:MAG TPA: hypothetical protein VIY52_22465 [Streptosporangiaceae bacterium]
MPAPSSSAVSDAAVLGDGDADPGAGGDDGADADPEGDGDEEPGGDAEEDGEAPGCGDPAAPDADPATRWPAAICAEPVVTSVRVPTRAGARAGTGAACPLMPPAPARVADAGT